MTGVCEGGNEPPGSLKTITTKAKYSNLTKATRDHDVAIAHIRASNALATFGTVRIETEAVNGIPIPLKSVCARVLAATGISKRTLARIRKVGKNIEAETADSFSSPEKSQPKKKKIIAAVDSFDEEVLRRLIYNFYATHKQRPTLQKLLAKMDIGV
ncbi:hypothetical protein ANN_11131 [Periplaneta americana]|uniref:Uncharacterized protein n=1 Tax=Periplaneta americana TaxID=6978 RepID=A0ABQ8T5W0_PERAM|nr:hypothetical protein ANN_11131 [Periplaneta americana]